MRRFFIALLLLLLSSTVASAETPTSFLITCDRFFDGVSDQIEGPTRVLVEGGKITAVGPAVEAPAGVERIDLEGMTLMPGFIDAHTHLTYLWTDTTKAPDYLTDYLGSPVIVALRAAKNAEKTLRAGFTTVREMGSADGLDLALAQAVAMGLIEGPRILTAGGLYPAFPGRSDITWPPDGTVGNAADISRKTREYLGQGCDWIKIYATSGTYDDTTGVPYFTEAEIGAAVEAAHPRNRWVAAHVMGLEGARRAVEAGVRSIEHGSRLDEKLAKEMAKKGIWLVPTIYHLDWYSRHGTSLGYADGFADRLSALLRIQTASLALARREKVRIGCGSDAVYSMHGENAQEIVWLNRIGLPVIEALKAATSVNAAMLGLDQEIGRVAPGYTADLVAVPGDPAMDIGSVTRPAFVMKNGKVVVRP